MKKFVVLLFGVIFLSFPAFAVEYNAEFKDIFYDSFLKGMFLSLEISLKNKDVPQDKVNRYVNAMKGRINRTRLENMTWACVSKYTPTQMSSKSEEIAQECFSKWVDDYFIKNQDLLKLLK